MPTERTIRIEREIEDALASPSPAPPAPGQLLGVTASGKRVEAPRRPGAPDTNDVLVFRKTKAKFPGWSKEDHMDASRFLAQASAAATDAGNGRLASTLSRWADVHWDIGGRWTGPEFGARFPGR